MNSNFNDSSEHKEEAQKEPTSHSYSYSPTPLQTSPTKNPAQKKKSAGNRPNFGVTLLVGVICVVLSGVAGFVGAIAGNLFSDTTRNLSGMLTSSESESTSGDISSAPFSDTSSGDFSDLTSQAPSDALTTAEVAERVGDSVVEIVTEVVTTDGWHQQYVTPGAGSGVIISTDGYIVTNNHVIEDASRISVTLRDGTSYQATLKGTDSETDIALLKIDASNLTPAILGDSDSLVVGEMAVAIGNPLGQLGGTVTDGIISALDREIELDGVSMNLLQTNAAINPGNSGGGLFDSKGKLVGIVVAKTSATGVEGLGFAIPINDVKPIVEQLSTYGYVRGRIDLGMALVDIDSMRTALSYRVSSLGLYVLKVESGSNAEAAGFRSGDRIISAKGQEVEYSDSLSAILDRCSVGETVEFVIVRSRKEYTVSLTLEEYTPS
ncbi:MAG: trypsin-like peptidase domain-containing protein [Oscillospiraceae bacterium]|nr:trypsin-like peptidase domain-containing protein [Oscillospiraceae bacterium]